MKKNKSKLGHTKSGLEAQLHPTIRDIAWAGIYEGEGCCYQRPKSINQTKVSIAQHKRNLWLLQRLKNLFGGTIYGPYKNQSRNICLYYHWQITGARARGFLMTMYTFLSPYRKSKIKEIL